MTDGDQPIDTEAGTDRDQPIDRGARTDRDQPIDTEAGTNRDQPIGSGPASLDEPASAPARRRVGPAALISAVVFVVLVAFVVVLASSEPATSRRADSPLLGRPAPATVGVTLDDEPFDLRDLRGRFVVVNFFATWCTPCIQEHPELDSFQRDHRRLGDAEVVSILYDDQSGSAQDFFDRYGGDWPVIIDPDGRLSLSYGVAGVPETYLVAPDGTVVTKLIGGVTQIGLESVIEGYRTAVAGS